MDPDISNRQVYINLQDTIPFGKYISTTTGEMDISHSYMNIDEADRPKNGRWGPYRVDIYHSSDDGEVDTLFYSRREDIIDDLPNLLKR